MKNNKKTTKIEIVNERKFEISKPVAAQNERTEKTFNVKTLAPFHDLKEDKHREINDIFEVNEERYLQLVSFDIPFAEKVKNES